MPKQKIDASSRVNVNWGLLRNTGASLSLLLAACAGDVVNLGENGAPPSAPVGSRCQSSTTVEGSVSVESQEQLDALEGCEVITGDLEVTPFASANLHALHALLRVEGELYLGAPSSDTPPDGETYQEQLDRSYAEDQLRGSWLEALDGLERLEEVGDLKIFAGSLLTLKPLSGLQHILSSSLQVMSDELEDLSGLEGVRGISTIYVVGSKLRDISALRLPATINSLDVEGPIETLDLSGVKSLLGLKLAATALENLDALKNLTFIDGLDIADNPKLQNLDGLNQLAVINDLSVTGNAALQLMGSSFSSLVACMQIQIAGNDNLTELPSFPSMTGDHSATPITLQYVDISQNRSLQHLRLPEGWNVISERFYISDNQALEDIDFVALASIGKLDIEIHPSLTHVRLGALSAVASLVVTYNHLLPPSDFDGVRSFESDFRGDAGEP